MIIKKIILKNYCLISDLIINFKKINFLSGESQSGKSSILDAVYFSTTGISHFTNQPSRLIKNNEKFLKTRIFFQDQKTKYEEKILVFPQKSEFYQNEKKISQEDFFLKETIISHFINQNILKDNNHSFIFFHSAFVNLDPEYQISFKNLTNEIKFWNDLTTNQQITPELLKQLQETEKKIVFYTQKIINIFQKMILIWNSVLQKNIKVFFVKKIPNVKINLIFENGEKLINKLIEKRQTKKIESLSWRDFWKFKFEFLNWNQKFLTFKEEQLLDIVIKASLAEIIRKQTGKEVVFILDDFDFFDLETRLKIYQNIKLNQCIITTNSKKKWFLEEKNNQEIQFLKVKKHEKK